MSKTIVHDNGFVEIVLSEEEKAIKELREENNILLDSINTLKEIINNMEHRIIKLERYIDEDRIKET